MVWLWCLLLALPALVLSSPVKKPSSLLSISLGPVDSTDKEKVNGDCKVPMRHDGYLWHQATTGLWFQATGAIEVEDKNYTTLSNRLECAEGSSSCTLTINSIASVTASETWSLSYSTSVKLGVKFLDTLTSEASVTTGIEYSRTSSTTTSSETSYSCSISGNHTVHLGARVQFYLVYGYISEYVIVRRKFVFENGNIVEYDYWGWEESCQPLYRIPKIQFDGSVAGTRRCIVEPLKEKDAEISVIRIPQ